MRIAFALLLPLLWVERVWARPVPLRIDSTFLDGPDKAKFQR